MLSEQQLQNFHRDGYVKGERVLSEQQVDVLREEILRVIQDRDTSGVPQPVLLRDIGKPQQPVWQIVNIWQASEPFQELIHQPTIIEEIAQLTSARAIRIWHDQIQYKPAATGGVNMWHQDAPYWPVLEPMTQVSAWVALDDVDEQNGCMSMVPGSHLWGNQIEFLHTLRQFDDMPPEFQGQRIEVRLCPVRKGEVHYHHALTWHGSRANTSDRPRRAVALHYMTQETRFVAAAEHVMKPLVAVSDGEVLQGRHFPLLWSVDQVHE